MCKKHGDAFFVRSFARSFVRLCGPHVIGRIMGGPRPAQLANNFGRAARGKFRYYLETRFFERNCRDLCLNSYEEEWSVL